jgi:hypothetical protein|tara:strand:+ start:113 stop:250 length:138 start_codon:yes stop_codon:yes gene_type:complete
MPEYQIVLNIETEMGDPREWDWKSLIITDPDVEKLIDVAVTTKEG